MIVSQLELGEILRGEVGETIVKRDPPAVGDEVWPRRSPRAMPACRAVVVDVWSHGEGFSVLLRKVDQGAVRRPSPPTDSDFAVTAEQRQRLLKGDYSPLDFPDEPAFEPGARYVLTCRRPTATVLDADEGEVAYTPRAPVWFLTVTEIQRHRKGFWRVKFDVTDLRDPDLFLKRGGGLTSFDELKAGRVPDRQWLEIRAKAIAEGDAQRRLAKFAEEARLRGRERSKARRKRAA